MATTALIAKCFAYGLLIWFALLAALIAVRILRGEISISGVLANDGNGAGVDVHPERALAVAVFPAILIYYVIQALHADLSGAIPSLPDVPDFLVTLLTGSNSIYLAGKIARS